MNTDIIKSFMTRVKGATASRQPELRLTTIEAQQLAAAIGELMSDRIDKLEAISDMSFEVKVGGGSLK